LMRGCGICKSEELVESQIHRVTIGCSSGPGLAVVPFAEEGCGIAPLPKRLGYGDLAIRQVIVVSRHAVVDSVPPSHEGGAGGAARGSCRIEPLEDGALFGEAVEVGGFPVLAAVETDIAPAQVVGEDEDNVGRRTCRMSRFGRRRRKKRFETDKG